MANVGRAHPAPGESGLADPAAAAPAPTRGPADAPPGSCRGTSRPGRPRNDPGQYDDLADAWWDRRGIFAMLHWIAEARGRLVPPAERPGAVLLDLGCGAGLLAPHLAGKGYAHVGVDLTASALAQAADHGVRCVRGDVLRLPFADGCADVVSAGEILEHVDDLDAGVAEACRVLRPGGRLVIDTIAATRLGRFVAVTLAERVPGGAPRGIHDPALFVDRSRLVAVAAGHGVELRLRGIRPSLADLPRWLLGRRGSVRMVPLFTSAVLFQAVRGQGRGSFGVTASQTRLADPAAAVAAAAALVPALAERAAEHDRAGLFPVADFDDLRGAGLLGLMAPARLGGPGAGFADYAEVAMTLAAGNGATALVFNMHASVTGAMAQTPDELARKLGVPETYFAARDRVLESAVGGALFAVAMSERGAGSRLSALTTAYAPVDGGYRIQGAKTFVSGAGHADSYLVAAKASDGRVSHFLVPAGDGVTVEHTWDSLGMRATGSHDLHLDVTVPADALLGGLEGLTLLLAQVMPQWLVASYAAVYVGVAQAAVDACVAHVAARRLGHLPAVRARIGRADAAAAAARLAVLEAARRIDTAPGEPETNRWIWRAKLLAGQTAMDVAASMLEAAGTSASRRGHPLERLFRDARCGSLQPATSDVCADWLGVAAIGGDPEGDAAVPRW